MPRKEGRGGGVEAAAGGELAAAFLLGLALIAAGAPLLAARLRGDDPATPAALDPAAAAPADRGAGLRAALARAPADPAGWLELARAEEAAGGSPAEMAKALRLSIMTGPREPALLLPRLELALAAWPRFADEDRPLVADQIRLAWSRYPRALALLARRLDAGDLVRAALGEADAAAFARLSAEIDPNAIRS